MCNLHYATVGRHAPAWRISQQMNAAHPAIDPVDPRVVLEPRQHPTTDIGERDVA